MLTSDQAKQLYWLVRECYTHMVSATTEDLKAGGNGDLHDQTVNVTGEVGHLKNRLADGVESLSDRQRQVLKFVVAYVRRYRPEYRLPSGHPQYSKYERKYARIKLAETLI